MEGEDLAILKIFQDKLSPGCDEPFDTLLNMSIQGSGNWKLALGASMGLKNAAGEEIKTYCLLDRDYRTDEKLAEIKTAAKRGGLQMHIWSRKEIENYLLVPEAIQRCIAARMTKSKRPPTTEVIIRNVMAICDQQRDTVTDAIATEILAQEKKGLKPANTMARKKVEQAWEGFDSILAMVSGKTVISRMSDWSKKRYGVSFAGGAIARSLLCSEIDTEVQTVVRAIETSDDLDD